ncbi:hypothetical protein BRD17_05425 [Halobacteriales archaeon SW_7_68_16]|nr:MAG: hypothetical protein BRD17_05425 [Halobacteriales archaeon SW_7_68_16]
MAAGPAAAATTRRSPGESETATVSLVTVDRRGAVAFAVDYATGTERGQSTARFEYRPATGAIELTGVDLTLLDEDTLRIEGNAGNAGDATVRGVVLAVGDSPTVTPAYPQRDYFVGTVEGSEFAPFDLTATVDTANATTIPVRVTAVIDGETTTRTVALPYDEDLEPPDTGGGGFPTDLLIGAGLGAVLAGVVAVVLRLRRGGSDER